MNDLQRSADDEAERVNGLAHMVEQIPRRRVVHAKVHGHGAEAAVTGQPKGRMLVEDLPIQVNANVRSHVLRTVAEHLLRVDALRHGPGGDDVVHDTLAERLRKFVQLHKLPNIVEHVVVLGRGTRHLLNDGRHMTEDGRVEEG